MYWTVKSCPVWIAVFLAIGAEMSVARLRPAQRPGGRGLHLPLHPIGTGFWVNTVLYALLGLVVYAAARDVIRVVRRRRDIVLA